MQKKDKIRLIILFVVLLTLSLNITKVFRLIEVSGNSMNPNLETGELIITSQLFDFKKGDMIAFYYDDMVLIKRAIAEAGDMVNIEKNGEVYVNNEKLEESYITNLAYGESEIIFPYQVPENSVFVLGDNRANSIDSRNKQVGSIDKGKVIGKIAMKLSPLVVY